MVAPSLALQTSRQLHDECQLILSTSAQNIIARVRKLDFGHVIRFFNRCDDLELAKSPRSLLDSDNQDEKMVIELEHRDLALLCWRSAALDE